MKRQAEIGEVHLLQSVAIFPVTSILVHFWFDVKFLRLFYLVKLLFLFCFDYKGILYITENELIHCISFFDRFISINNFNFTTRSNNVFKEKTLTLGDKNVSRNRKGYNIRLHLV